MLIYISAIVILFIFLFFATGEVKEKMDALYRPVVKLHYTEWCPACKRFKPIWGLLKQNRRFRFIENDEEKNSTDGVNAYPTLMLTIGDTTYKYNGLMEYDNINKWLNNYRLY